MEELRYWVWLSQCFTYGSATPAKVMEVCPSPKALYEMSDEERREITVLSEKDRRVLEKTPLDFADRILKECARFKIRILPMNDPEYPARLRHIYAPPVVLYVLGSLAGLDEEPTIAIVGTRKMDDYSRAVTEYLATGIAKAGGVIVSGCALGIDAVAHRSAVLAGKRTIAVLACGLDVNYPVENAKLKRSILNNGGALVSEYPPGKTSGRHVFQVRNRIMAGLSNGVLVTHAPIRSGALLTAGHAIDQGKDLFCVPPYSLFDPEHAGVIRYLRDGAIPAFSPEDVLLPYYAEYSDKIDLDALKGDPADQKVVLTTSDRASITAPRVPKIENTAENAENAKKVAYNEEKIQKNPETVFDELHTLVYNQLDTHPLSIDDLAIGCELDIGTLYSILTDLELDGYVKPLGGGRYCKVD